MKTLTTILVIIIAIEHFYFLMLEMFFWNTKKGLKTFGLESMEFAEKTKVLAANQGLYNGFLASGLIFGVVKENIGIIIFFLVCIIIAGIYGAYSTKKTKLFYVQGIPAIITLVVIMLNS